jgi:hypothetical protein
MRVEELFKKWNWKPIRNCPGRYILSGEGAGLTPAEVLGEAIRVSEHKVEAARDTVMVARLDGGGLISYARADGSYIHTLNTPEGFRRKLLQLGIEHTG